MVCQKSKFYLAFGRGKSKTIPSVGRNPKNSFMLIPKFRIPNYTTESGIAGWAEQSTNGGEGKEEGREMEFKKTVCTQNPTTLILILLIHMSNTVKESISAICVILSFLCSSWDTMCHLCLHNSQVPDPAFSASHTDHKSESAAHKSCATEH